MYFLVSLDVPFCMISISVNLDLSKWMHRMSRDQLWVQFAEESSRTEEVQTKSHLWGRLWAALAIPPSFCLLQSWDSFGANIPRSWNQGCGYPTAMGDSQEINLSILCMEEVRLPLGWGRGAEKLNDTSLELNARVGRAEAVRLKHGIDEMQHGNSLKFGDVLYGSEKGCFS